jgi:hypothetical protein
MSNGGIAYEVTLEKRASFDQIVNIFAYEDQDIAHDISEQRSFQRKWINSLKNIE